MPLPEADGLVSRSGSSDWPEKIPSLPNSHEDHSESAEGNLMRGSSISTSRVAGLHPAGGRRDQ
jgi:hypothetical protein